MAGMTRAVLGAARGGRRRLRRRRRRRRRAAARPRPAAGRDAAPARPPRRPAPRAASGCARSATSTSPVYVTAPPGDRARQFVVEQGGRVHGRSATAASSARRSSTSRGQVTAGGEQGLLSIAFAPDYADSGLFYVYFTDEAGDQRIVEYRRRDADRADPGSARLVLRMADDESNHNGGLLLFGPDDLLYVGTGRRRRRRRPARQPRATRRTSARCSARSCGSTRARAAAAPTRSRQSNPFVGRAGARGEIYAYGLRNPWRFSFDRKTGDLAIGDVGPERVGGDRLRARAARAAARTSAGGRSRAARATRPASPRPATCGR